MAMNNFKRQIKMGNFVIFTAKVKIREERKIYSITEGAFCGFFTVEGEYPRNPKTNSAKDIFCKGCCHKKKQICQKNCIFGKKKNYF